MDWECENQADHQKIPLSWYTFIEWKENESKGNKWIKYLQ